MKWPSLCGPVVALVALGLVTACSSTIGSFPTEDAPMVTENPAETYTLEPGNRVRITVFNENNLSGDFTLDPSGNLSMPLLGNLPAAGLNVKALVARIEEALRHANLMQDPKVAVEIQTYRPFYVLGEVRQPGEFPYVSGMTVLSAIAKSGGYDYRAREEDVVLVRAIKGTQKYFRANERTPILPGDIIKVLERRF
jgi:polysaccharide export outer membrane protein